MAKISDIFGENIIIVRPDKDEPRVCDYCNTDLVAPGGIVIKEAFLTDYGLMCKRCLGDTIPAIREYKPGEDVSGTAWYTGCDLN
jgi:hypothetical protein